MQALQSFRVRIALLSVCLSGLVLAAFTAWAWYMVQRSNLGRVDDSLREIAQRHLMFPHDRSHWAQVDKSLQFVFGEDTGRVVLLVVDAQGRLLHRSSDWPDTLRPVDSIPENALTDPVPEFPAPPQPELLPPPFPPDIQRQHRPNGPPDRLRPPPAMQGPPRDGRGQPPPGREPRRGPGIPADRPAPPPPQEPLPVIQINARTMTAAGETWRVGVFRDPEVTFAIAVELTGYAARLAGARTGFMIAFPLALTLIAIGSWFLANRALRPVDRLRDAIAEVTSQGLDKRVPNTGEADEFQQLTAQFNRMMERLERSFAQAARFSADAAHELKTPLAVLQGEIEQALQTASPETQVLLGRLLDEVQRLKSITQKLLLLARADAGQLNLHLEPTDLSAMVRELAEDIETAAPQLHVTSKIEDGIFVMADRDLLHRLLQNLADNAMKYNRDGGNVGFKLDAKNGLARLQIANTGEIAPEKREKIFDRFVRVDDARSRRVDGAGLGLSLAREIARAHGGELTLEKSDNGIVTFMLQMRLAR